MVRNRLPMLVLALGAMLAAGPACASQPEASSNSDLESVSGTNSDGSPRGIARNVTPGSGSDTVVDGGEVLAGDTTTSSSIDPEAPSTTATTAKPGAPTTTTTAKPGTPTTRRTNPTVTPTTAKPISTTTPAPTTTKAPPPSPDVLAAAFYKAWQNGNKEAGLKVGTPKAVDAAAKVNPTGFNQSLGCTPRGQTVVCSYGRPSGQMIPAGVPTRVDFHIISSDPYKVDDAIFT